jgi:hypothetical protein
MALWGKADSIYSPGTISLVYATKVITGSGTSFSSANVGSVIYIGTGNTVGEAVIDSVTNATTISIASTQFLSGVAVAGLAYTTSQQPKYLMQDSNYDLQATTVDNKIRGVDEYEAAALTATSSQYAVAHAGWVGVHTYTDMHGNVRVKSETLVAMSGISSNLPPVDSAFGSTGDANDDATLPDRFITIAGVTASPSAAVGVGTTVTLTVSASATPTAALSYQWQKSTTANGTTYASIGGETSASVSIGNTNTANNNYNYRVVVTSTGGATATSSATKLTVS